ncbi:MAG: PASTA domain-containing protein [Acidobacteria bacterium]|nr:PASTA domain-containing protein [Acidobacteriota bacterium]
MIHKGEVMKTYSRIFGLLIPAILLLVVYGIAQEPVQRKPTPIVRQQTTVVSQTRATQKATPTPTPSVRFRVPSKIPVESRLPDVFREGPQQRQNYPRMPSLTGMNVQTAESTVRQVQSSVQISRQSGQYTSSQAPGVVISHTPERGAFLKPGAEVVLYLNPQPGPTIPNLRGVNVEVAERMLRRPFPNLIIRRVAVPDTYVEPNTVARHTPATGEPYNARTVVTLYFRQADPVQMVFVPDVKGMLVIDAKRRLNQANLGVSVPTSRNVDEYIVTGQSPLAGTRAPIRSVVTLTVQRTVTVPDVTRRSLDDATQILGQSRLRVGSVTKSQSTAAANEVLSQNPPPGNVVAVGTGINLMVAEPRYVIVPDVQNQPRNSAERVIIRNGLTVGQVELREFSAAAGTVIGQIPAPGSRVLAGSSVNLVVAIPQMVVVPNLSGRLRNEAEQLVRRAGLVIGQVTTRESGTTNGSVLSQTPSAGERVAIGSAISLVVAVPLPATPIPTPTPTPMPTPTPAPTPTPTPTVTPTPSPVVTPTPLLFVVPDLKDKELTEAVRLVRTSQLEVGEISREDPKETASFVLKQQPEAGQLVAAGTRVNLVIGKKADGGPPRKDWLTVLLVGALGFAALFLARLWKRLRPKPGPEPVQPPAATLTFRTTMNASAVEFASSTDWQTSFALRFQPKADWGQQYITLTGGLVTAESEER